MLNGLSCKVFKTQVTDVEGNAQPGEYRSDGKSYLHFRTGDGWLAIEELQIEGKKRMMVGDFLRGYKLQ
ncbi:methionyl-tRNA formyltransferase [compost metagenome]